MGNAMQLVMAFDLPWVPQGDTGLHKGGSHRRTEHEKPSPLGFHKTLQSADWDADQNGYSLSYFFVPSLQGCGFLGYIIHSVSGFVQNHSKSTGFATRNSEASTSGGEIWCRSSSRGQCVGVARSNFRMFFWCLFFLGLWIFFPKRIQDDFLIILMCFDFSLMFLCSNHCLCS